MKHVVTQSTNDRRKKRYTNMLNFCSYRILIAFNQIKNFSEIARSQLVTLKFLRQAFAILVYQDLLEKTMKL